MYSTAEKPNLSITGENIVLKPKCPPQLVTRKIYNSTYFRDEQYRHEIANHYRDFKQRPRIRRRRRRNIFVRYRKPIIAISIGAKPFEYRDELQMSIQEFPRFAQVYTPPRGRQCECENRPPDETLNDTVRRIHTANSCEELKALVQRHTNYIASNLRRKGNLAKFENPKHSTKVETASEEYNNFKEEASQNKAQQARRQKRRRSLGNLESITITQLQRKQFESLEEIKKKSELAAYNDESREEYLKQANDYYERGLLANIKYLESIPERNAIIRARGDYIRTTQKKNCKINDNNKNKTTDTASKQAIATAIAIGIPTTISACENNWNHSRVTSAKSNASQTSTNTDETTTSPRPPAHSSEIKNKKNNKIGILLKLIGRQRSFKINNKDKFQSSPRNWNIRVNIIPQQQTQSENDEKGDDKARSTQVQTKKFQNQQNAYSGSMHDLNANTGFITTEIFDNNQNNNNTSTTRRNLEAFDIDWSSSKHLHDLIDNLTHLDLNATSAAVQQGLVPSITLTDYCTLSNFYNGQEPQSIFALNKSAAVAAATATAATTSSASSSAIVLKPTKFGNKINLDIPSDTNFQNEARPP